MSDPTSKSRRDVFIAAIARFIQNRQAAKGLILAVEIDNPLALDWAAVRDASGVRGYPTFEEARAEIERTLALEAAVTAPSPTKGDAPWTCPHCGVSLLAQPIPEESLHYYRDPYKKKHGPDDPRYFKREIGIYDMALDRTVAYKCPDCGENPMRPPASHAPAS